MTVDILLLLRAQQLSTQIEERGTILSSSALGLSDKVE